MNASKAKRRWIAWSRYVQKTGSRITYPGHAKAHQDVMFASRAYPRGVRVPFYPKWSNR